MDRGAWWATVRGVTESDMTEGLTLSLWASLVAQMVKNLPANAGNTRDAGSVPGLGRSPGEENGYPLQYSWQENPMDRGAWWATIHGVTNSSTQLRNKHLRYAVEIIGNKLILLTCFECVVGRSRASFSVGLV